MVTLEQVRSQSAPELYPRHVLDGCETALVLFAAAWHGKQDAIHIADAGLTATCVDTDTARLAAMERAYPAGWEFVAVDAFVFASRTDRRWDVVSVDCPTSLFDRCAELLPLWALLARRVIVLGCGTDTDLVAPAGWTVSERRLRSHFRGGVYWAVLERA